TYETVIALHQQAVIVVMVFHRVFGAHQIGGIIVSNVLSLVVVPSFFLIMDDLSRLIGWAFGRLVGRKDNEEMPLSREDLTRVTRENRDD
ncbi:hypothetical protein AB9F45_36390, partial [Rhizobium leguminosarum]|uniref:hypothetical protein n=1 Tax=Rhizobium leguminosarum TaxID=384 RepID=UPI003F97DBF7